MKDTMLKKNEIQQIHDVIERYNRFVITTHVNPDGDALGSEMAMARYLQQRGKQVSILNSSPTPETFHFLDPKQQMQQFDPDRHIEVLTSSDVLFILDISDWQRLRELGELVQTLPIEKVCIDHHLRDGRFVDVDVIHPQASSTGELLYELFLGLGAKLTVPICEALYTAILTDTGGFRFSNTSPRVMRIAADLMERGIDRQRIYREIYESQPLTRVKLMARMLDNLTLGCGGRLAWMHVTQDMLTAVGTTMKDTEGFSDFPRTIQGVEVALLFLELEDGDVKISFRSQGTVAINALARRFGGGGHEFASGARTEGPIEAAMERVVTAAKELFPDC